MPGFGLSRLFAAERVSVAGGRRRGPNKTGDLLREGKKQEWGARDRATK